MGFVNILIEQMERSTAGSEDTVRLVLKMCRIKSADKLLFFGDDLHTPRIIAEETGANVTAAFAEEQRARAAEQAGLNAKTAGMYEVLETEGGWNVIWFNGLTEPDGIPRRLEQLRGNLANGGIAVYRTLCWLIDPSPDTKSYIDRRFGKPVPLDAVLREAKSAGFAVEDFYIAPKSDWKQNFYEPMSELVKSYEGASGEEAAGIGEINKEMYMFDLHSEEYSFVYYVLRRV